MGWFALDAGCVEFNIPLFKNILNLGIGKKLNLLKRFQLNKTVTTMP